MGKRNITVIARSYRIGECSKTRMREADRRQFRIILLHRYGNIPRQVDAFT